MLTRAGPSGGAPRVGRSLVVAGIVLLGGIGLSACGSKSAASKSSTTTTSPTTTTTSGSTTTTSPTACSAALLQFGATFGGAAAGGTYYTITATNIGPDPCSLDGYPTISFYAPSGAGGAGAGSPVSITVQDGGSPPTSVIVAPKGEADFLLVFTDVPVNGEGCASVASAEITPPGSSDASALPISFEPCGGTVKVYAFGSPGSESP
jgi:hypothetical protein